MNGSLTHLKGIMVVIKRMWVSAPVNDRAESCTHYWGEEVYGKVSGKEGRHWKTCTHISEPDFWRMYTLSLFREKHTGMTVMRYDVMLSWPYSMKVELHGSVMGWL